jgi:hypothetical protein
MGYPVPDPALVGYEFARAGGTASGGLSTAALFSYWEAQGIAGVRIAGVRRLGAGEDEVEQAVARDTALLVLLDFSKDAHHLGGFSVNGGWHMAVVDGYTPEGPLVATWGETVQMTWAQWRAEAKRVTEVEVR